MRIWILSDLHTEFREFAFPRVEADVLVAAGDIGVGLRGAEALMELAPLPVVYVAGNHEYYKGSMPGLTEALREKCAGTNVRFLENEEAVIGGWGGVRFLGCTLWTDFCLFGKERMGIAMEVARLGMADFRLIRKSPSYGLMMPVDTVEMHRRSRAWLEGRAGAAAEKTVVVTHHAPHPVCSNEKHRGDLLTAAFVSDCSETIQKVGADLWVHGHTHFCHEAVVGRTRIVSNQRGRLWGDFGRGGWWRCERG